jgi:hypothetical protein
MSLPKDINIFYTVFEIVLGGCLTIRSRLADLDGPIGKQDPDNNCEGSVMNHIVHMSSANLCCIPIAKFLFE